MNSGIGSIRKEYSNYLGPIFEEIARQFLILNRGNDFDFTMIGKWWFKEREIDIIALKEKAPHVEWRNENRQECYVLFAKSFKERIDEPGLLLFDLKDMEDKMNSRKSTPPALVR